jgi:phosphohistidine phosphatase
MKDLLILRHAKSSWKHHELQDHDRPLNGRGRRDAERMGLLLREEMPLPGIVVSSSAVRAYSTARLVAEACELDAEVRLAPDLYLAGLDVYIALIRGVPDRYDCLMVVGHNPDVERLIDRLTGMDETMPTGALAWVRLPIDSWDDLGPDGSAELASLRRPKELRTD